MTEYLYVPEQSTCLAERWLRKAADASVVLVHDSKTEASALRDAFPNVERTDALDSDAQLESDRVVVPISLDSRPIEYKPGVFLPQVEPHYNLVAKLWRRGFRQFTWYDLAGERTMHAPNLLETFANKYKGQRCFVAGNGPSLQDIDMTRLKDEIVLGANRCYLGYEQWGFSFPFWGVYDQYQIEAYDRDYEANVPPDCTQFFPFYYWPLLRFPNACPVNIGWPESGPHQFSASPERIFRGHTVTYMLLQIAAVMGCDPIVLIGTDHRYNLSRPFFLRRQYRRFRRRIVRHLRGGALYRAARAMADERLKAGAWSGAPAHVWEAKDSTQATHFDPRYTEQGARRFLPPEPEEAEADFRCARAWAEANGVQILNATPGSALDVFPKVDFDSVF